ncbi:MAG: hypothetical protein MN733_32885 [Nitrososphaera sp.]|nr:hypothetical protein [Nitrososphaera sp.]
MPLPNNKDTTGTTDWWSHLQPGDMFHTGNPDKCGVCGCESDYWVLAKGSWFIGPRLICPGSRRNRSLHEKIERKKNLLFKDELPPTVTGDLRHEIAHLIAQIHAEVAASAVERTTKAA